MRKMTYWIAPILDDSSAYNVRGKTRREVVARVNEMTDDPTRFGEPKKVSVEYDDLFDLVCQCLGEGHGYWED